MNRFSYTSCFLSLIFLPSDLPASETDFEHIAKQVDQAIAEELFNHSTDLAPPCNDATFLRRVHLDLVGDIPAPEEVIAFALDRSPNKRRQRVQQLLDSSEYGQNWARYWRDVIFYRAQDERSNIAKNSLESELTRRLNANDRWNDIAGDFVTATGDVRREGTTAIIMAQDARTEETTAEISRVFLGIQIQCAQCHDHPYDRWKREQFHELAAFFPRVGVRNTRTLTKRSFEVFGNDRYRNRPPRKDNNNRPEAEHRMPDLEDPSQFGTEMQPKFFLTGSTIPKGTPDHERREQLADWLTENEWFAIAFVNRMWSEFVGEGFYEPVDDIGPDREASAQKALDILTEDFRNHGYDVKRLMEIICLTETYQRESRPRRGTSGIPFAANAPQPLRSDQLFNALLSALEVQENRDKGREQFRERERFDEIFGFDPSQSRESVSSSIPQVLAMMNSYQVNRYLNPGRKENLLNRMLQDVPGDEDLVVDLYLRCLSREPTESELEMMSEHVTNTSKRKTAFEDILWALLNSAEFQYRQ